MAKLPVMEVFGPTIQGEGMVIGRKTMFVRTAGCDYQCVWCDSKFTWDGSERAEMLTAEEVWQRLHALGGDRFDHVTISGGNPALLKEAMAELVDLLHHNGVRVGLETQGSVWRDWLVQVDDLTVSPKPPSSGMQTNWPVLDELASRLCLAETNWSLKAVVFDDVDFEYAITLHQRYPEVPMYLSVGNEDVYAGGDVSGPLLERLQWLVERTMACAELNDVRVLPQLHVLLWGNKRGV